MDNNSGAFRLIGTNGHTASPPKGPFQWLKRHLQVRFANWLFGDEPVIWTSKGNLPEAVLETTYEWGQNDTNIVFVKSCKYNGVEVKREPHIVLLAPRPITAEQGTL